jgi:hypothetical protein
MRQEIINFFGYLTEFTGTKINGVESIPIIYWGENYVTGFKADDSNNIMVRFKLVKRIDLTALSGERTDYYMMNPDAEFWLPYEFLDETTIDEVFKEMSEKVMALKHYDILHIEHMDKLKEKKIEEGIIFTSKRLACKEAMNYRRRYKDHFSMKFLEMGEKPQKEKEMSTFEFATSAL